MSLACEVCYEAYASYPSDKVPRIFPRCGHDFCTRCIKIVCSSKDNVFLATCPKCRAFLFPPSTCGDAIPGQGGGLEGWCTLGISGPPPPAGSSHAGYGFQRFAQARALRALPGQTSQTELPRPSSGGGLANRNVATGNGPSSVFFSNSSIFYLNNRTTSAFDDSFFERTSEAVSLAQRLADNAGVLNAIVAHFPVLRCALQLTERLDFNDALHCQGLVPRVLQVATDAMLLGEVRKRRQILEHLECRAVLQRPSKLQPRKQRPRLIGSHSLSEACRVGSKPASSKRSSGREVRGVIWRRLRHRLRAHGRYEKKKKGKELFRPNVFFYVQKKPPSPLFGARWRLCVMNRATRSDGATWGPSGGPSLCGCRSLPNQLASAGFPRLAADEVFCSFSEASGAWKWPYYTGGGRAKPQLYCCRPSFTGCRWCTFSPRLKQRFSADEQVCGTSAGHYTFIRPKCRLSSSLFFGRRDVHQSYLPNRCHLLTPALRRRRQASRSPCSSQLLTWPAPTAAREPLNRNFFVACCRRVGLLWIYGVISTRRLVQKCGSVLGAMEKEQTLQLVMIANAIPLLLCSFYLFYNPGFVLRLIAPVLAHR